MKKGARHSEETKQRMSESAKVAQLSTTARKVKSNAAIRRWKNYRNAIATGSPKDIAMKVKSPPKPKTDKSPLDELCEFWFTRSPPQEL